uniref:Transmembrane protein 154 n=1 Tax=Mola mola TaxID=94237 RepID=A0A3Q3VVG1_MOLML
YNILIFLLQAPVSLNRRHSDGYNLIHSLLAMHLCKNNAARRNYTDNGPLASVCLDPEDTTPTGLDTTSSPEEQEGLNPIIILIPVVLAVLIISMIVCCIFISRRWKKKDKCQEDPYLDGTTSEKVPMPMFEEDVPSVLELEMEELGQWMQNEGRLTKLQTGEIKKKKKKTCFVKF